MYSKAKIFNLALGALLLQRQVIDPETDKSNEAKVLLTYYDIAFRSTLEDLDLDSTSTQADLELIEEDPTDSWGYAYKYPSDCAFFRRIQSSATVDNRTTHIPKRVAIHEGKKVIFTDQIEAIAEYISFDVPLASLSATAGLAIAYRLAILSAPLVTGKGAQKLMEMIEKKYVTTKAEAQKQDREENFSFNDDTVDSEFVETRMS
jgi:hypothetical protein